LAASAQIAIQPAFCIDGARTARVLRVFWRAIPPRQATLALLGKGPGLVMARAASSRVVGPCILWQDQFANLTEECSSMTDYAALREMMVDTQVRPADVTKFPIIEAMLTVPKERFVPDGARKTAYVGANVDLGAGRVVLEPRTFAKMLDALDLQRDELVLDLGAGLGYSAAVIARLVEAVVAVEADPAMAADAQSELSEYGADNVAVVEASLTEGAAKHGPYDAIVIEGAAEQVPAALSDQLKDGGRIGCVFMEGALGVCRIGHKSAGRISWRYAFNGAAPVLPGFSLHPEFQL